MCIENSREHPADAALFGALIPYILHERKRFHHSDPAPGTVEQLMGLPDLRSYMKAIYTLNSEQYSSLGAVCLDIPGMACPSMAALALNMAISCFGMSPKR